jgi:biopolymer transport protein ExbD
VAFLRARDEEDIQFQMAPMIDVVFLLLIFFLVATSFISAESQIGTDLPQKREQQFVPEEMPKQFMVVVGKGGIVVNKRPMKKAEFRDKLIALVVLGEEIYVFVDVKDNARHGDVIEILDMVREVGAKVTVVPPYEVAD